VLTDDALVGLGTTCGCNQMEPSSSKSGNGPHSLENFIRTIKFGIKFLTVFSFEGSLIIRLYMKKHPVPFSKLMSRMTMICFFLHVILRHDQIFFEGTENGLAECNIFSTS
jgi:hypothetical protein